jgi:serine/threonine protein kinase
MPLTAGTRLGPYEIVTPLGAGGMGEVYKAKDTRLDRVVALKVLPAALAADPEFRERFEREAKSISALNHPNICALYDVGRQDGTEYLVMEYLEGETLAARIERGALPTSEALSIAIAIASALDRAHRQGIVHRDLKPGNVMLVKTGASRSGTPEAKLLDFGLAKINPRAALSAATTAALPAAGTPLTAQGTILGTFQYMAPEQIESEEIDARTDIFAFGAVLFEMLTGRKAFAGKSQASLLGAILKDEPPPVSQVQPLTPPALDRVVSTCLAKDREDRFHTAHDLLLQLRWVVEGGSAAGVPAPVVAHRRNRERVAWTAFSIATLLLLASVVPTWRYFHPAVDERQIQFSIPTPGSPDPSSLVPPVVSPDGRMVAMVAPAKPGGSNLIWVRAFDELDAKLMNGTDGVAATFWSPDSRHLAFFVTGKLMRIDVTGGSPQTVCATGGATSGAWSPDGTILFAGFGGGMSFTGGSLYRVAASGGTPVELLKPDVGRQETGYNWPVFLPDGRHFLFLSWSDEPGKRTIRVGSLDGGPPTVVLQAESQGAYGRPGSLLFAREGTLFSQSFDPDRLRLSGEPTKVGSNVMFNRINGYAAFSVSDNGVLVYRSGAPIDFEVNLAWTGRTGQSLGSAGPASTYDQLRLSPDGRHVVASRMNIRSARYELWTIDLTSGVTSQLTFDRPGSNDPVWSPDSKSIAFESIATGRREFYTQALGSQRSTPTFESAEDPKWLDDWSPDGKFLLYHLSAPSKLYALPLTGERKPQLLAEAKALLDSAHFSPDGHWVSYNVNDTGIHEVWVASFPTFDKRQQVSTRGGGLARWRGDGKELFYLTEDGQMMSVAIELDAKSGALTFKAPVRLFQSPLGRPNRVTDVYDVTRDGQRFLFVQPRPGAAPIVVPTTVVLNWQASAK